MSFEDCLRKGLIRRSETAGEKVEQSLLLADRFLKSARKNLEMEEYEVCEIISYNAIFHYGRALIFRKGYVERSHACLFLAILKLYPDCRTLAEKADKIRIERHGLQYAGFSATGDSASFVLDFAEEFGRAARKILEK